MQRKATAQSRGANALEKAHMQWIKERGICIACGNDAGVIIHHCVGSSYKVRVGAERVLIGHAMVLGLCICCDSIVTRGSHKAFNYAFGKYVDLWELQYKSSPIIFDEITINGIKLSGK